MFPKCQICIKSLSNLFPQTQVLKFVCNLQKLDHLTSWSAHISIGNDNYKIIICLQLSTNLYYLYFQPIVSSFSSKQGHLWFWRIFKVFTSKFVVGGWEAFKEKIKNLWMWSCNGALQITVLIIFKKPFGLRYYLQCIMLNTCCSKYPYLGIF